MILKAINRKAWFLAVFSLIAVAALFYALWPRPVNLRDFDPVAMGHAEANMWRCYYEGKWISLGWNLYGIMRHQFGFSPCDSLRLACHAGRGALIFRKSRNREAAERAIPHLTAYYGLIGERSQMVFDPKAAAMLEVEWWQLRREHADTETIGGLVARLVKLVHSTDNPALLEAAHLRARAMAYRDARRRDMMTQKEWDYLAATLSDSYMKLSQALSANNEENSALESENASKDGDH